MEAVRSIYLRAGKASGHRWLLLILLLFTLLAVAGYGIFALHPHLLAGMPALARFYSISFAFFAQVHVWLTGLVLAIYLYSKTGGRWVPAFAGVYVISLSSELIGTGLGLPFGAYQYTDLLGPKWLGQVPLVIPLSWFAMALPSYAIASNRFSSPDRQLRRVGAAAALLVTWDLSLDPAMSYLTAYWQWGEAGPYYGMPLINLAGWFLTGVAIMALFEWLDARRWLKRTSQSWMRAYYLIVLAMPVGMLIAAGVWGAVLATAVVLIPLLWILRPHAPNRPFTSRSHRRTNSNGSVDTGAESAHLPREFFRRHSKSFSFAARWFSREEYELVTCLYGFCRTTDDLVDQQEAAPGVAEKRLSDWMAHARASYEGTPSGVPWLDRIMRASADGGLPFEYVEELAEGVRMDLGPVQLENDEQLDTYTYRVASVVGIWMCHLFAADPDEETLRRAAAMGRAMQLTNIARDVGEDLEADRIYLPATMMRRHGVRRSDLEAMADGAPISSAYESMMEELMHRADASYAYAYRGLHALPSSFRRSAAVAAEVYRGIHAEIRRNGFNNLSHRAYTRRWRKLICAARGLVRLTGARPASSGVHVPTEAGPIVKAQRAFSRLGKGIGFLLLLFITAQAETGSAARMIPENRGVMHHVNVRHQTERPGEEGVPDTTLLANARRLYIRAVEEERAIDSLRTLAASSDVETPVLQAYRAAAVILRAKHTFWPHKKMNYLDEGLPVLDQLVEQYPDRIEIRYLRLLSCYFLPGFLGREWSVNEDFRALTRLLPESADRFPDELYREMVLFVIENGSATPAEESRLQAGLDDDSSAETDRSSS